MNKKLTWKQKMTKNVKKGRKSTTKHAIIALIITIVLLITINAFGGVFDRASAIQEDRELLFTATMVGDVMLGRYVAEVKDRYGYAHLFKYAEPYFSTSDYVTLNFDQPIVLRENSTSRSDGSIGIKTSYDAVKALKELKVTTVNLANDHVINYGQIGLEDTLHAFEDFGIDVVGVGRNQRDAQKILYQTQDAIKVATIGIGDFEKDKAFADGTRGGVLKANPESYMPLVMEAKENADLVIVHVHWGVEYDNNPSARQKEIARALSDAGADLIIGHHPHVLQPIEIYNDTVIFYSLGNFIYDYGISSRRESALVQYKLDTEGRGHIEVTPMWIREAQPRPLSGIFGSYRFKKIVGQLTKMMEAQDYSLEDHRMIIELNHSHIMDAEDLNDME